MNQIKDGDMYRWWYDQNGVDNEPEGEWNTEFGNMEEVNGWKEII